MISIYYYKVLNNGKKRKKYISAEKEIDLALKCVYTYVWLEYKKYAKSILFVHRTTKENELMLEIRNTRNYYLLKCDNTDSNNIQQFQLIGDMARDR